MAESLPLGLLMLWIVVLVGMIRSLNETKVQCCLYIDQPCGSVIKLCTSLYVVERCRIGIELVLKKEAGHI